MVRFGSIRAPGLLSGEHILGVGPGMGPDRSVRISGLMSVLLCLLRSVLFKELITGSSRLPSRYAMHGYHLCLKPRCVLQGLHWDFTIAPSFFIYALSPPL